MEKGEIFVKVEGERWYVSKSDDRSILDLSDFSIKNLKEVEGLERLSGISKLHLNLSFNELIDTSGLETLMGLEVLRLKSNKIVEIKGLEKLTNLSCLDLSHNQISKIRGLEKMTNLRRLDLSYNKITEITGLEKLINLQNLDLQMNQIREIAGLDSLRELDTLDRYHNQITELKGLEHLDELCFVTLDENSIPPKVLKQVARKNSISLDATKCVNYCQKASDF